VERAWVRGCRLSTVHNIKHTKKTDFGFMDIAKAVDIVDHSKLLQKLPDFSQFCPHLV
jgi:hypothetical protein